MPRDQDNLPARRSGTELSPFFGEDLLAPSSFFGGSPWQVMRRMQEDMDRLFAELVGSTPGTARSGAGGGLQAWTPSVDVSQNDQEWSIEAELPGVKREDIHVEVRDRAISLQAEIRQESERTGDGKHAQAGKQTQQGQQAPGGEQRQYHQRERRYGFFSRMLPLPDYVDENKIRCEFRDGVLTVHLPKTEQARNQVRRIPVQAAEGASGTGAANAGGAAPGATGARASASTSRTGTNQPGGYHEDQEETDQRQTAAAKKG